MLPLVLDTHSSIPIYAQIVEQIEGLVKKGILSPGDRLPPERDLARQLAVARGTVKKAYDELARKQLVEGTQGRGTFVARTHFDALGDRRQRALGAISRAIDVCEDLGFTPREIFPWFQLLVHQRSEERARIHALAIDCNPEALAAFSSQLQDQLGISIHGKLLDDLLGTVAFAQLCEPYDFIIVPSTHFDALAAVLEPVREKLVQVALAPTHQAIARAGTLNDDVSLAVACESERFFSIVMHWLRKLAGRTQKPLRIPISDIKAFDINSVQALVLPPGYRQLAEHLAGKTAQTGTYILSFDYHVEQGSVIHLQSLVKHIVQQRVNA